ARAALGAGVLRTGSPREDGREAGGLDDLDDPVDGDDVVLDVDLGAPVLAAHDGAVDARFGEERGPDALLIVGAPHPVQTEQDGRHTPSRFRVRGRVGGQTWSTIRSSFGRRRGTSRS